MKTTTEGNRFRPLGLPTVGHETVRCPLCDDEVTTSLESEASGTKLVWCSRGHISIIKAKVIHQERSRM